MRQLIVGPLIVSSRSGMGPYTTVLSAGFIVGRTARELRVTLPLRLVSYPRPPKR